MGASFKATVAFGLIVAGIAACGDESGVQSLDQVYGGLGRSGPEAPDASTPSSGSDRSDFEIDGSSCRVTSSSVVLVVSNGPGTALEYNGCRVRWTESSRVLTWQLTTSGTSGSLLSPADGSINVSIHEDAAENTSLRISPTASLLPPKVAVDEVVLVLTIGGNTVSARGSVRVGTNITDAKGVGGSLDITFSDVTFSGTPSGTSLGLRGSISLRAQGTAADRTR